MKNIALSYNTLTLILAIVFTVQLLISLKWLLVTKLTPVHKTIASINSILIAIINVQFIIHKDWSSLGLSIITLICSILLFNKNKRLFLSETFTYISMIFATISGVLLYLNKFL